MKKSLFRIGHQYFHINIDFDVHPIFKELDWIFIQKSIQLVKNQNSIEIHALVLMDTHLHLLICSKQKMENYFNEEIKARLHGSQRNQLECHCEPILNFAQYLNAYKYIYRNPIEAGLVGLAEQYLFSSLAMLMGHGAAHCEIEDHLGLIQNPVHLLKWVNDAGEYRFAKGSEFKKTSISNF